MTEWQPLKRAKVRNLHVTFLAKNKILDEAFQKSDGIHLKNWKKGCENSQKWKNLNLCSKKSVMTDNVPFEITDLERLNCKFRTRHLFCTFSAAKRIQKLIINTCDSYLKEQKLRMLQIIFYRIVGKRKDVAGIRPFGCVEINNRRYSIWFLTSFMIILKTKACLIHPANEVKQEWGWGHGESIRDQRSNRECL